MQFLPVSATETLIRETAYAQAGMAASSYGVSPLSTNEVCLRSCARRMRSLIPETAIAVKCELRNSLLVENLEIGEVRIFDSHLAGCRRLGIDPRNRGLRLRMLCIHQFDLEKDS